MQPGNTVLDIGAARGFFTARLAQLVGPQGCVHAFEPNPASLAGLEVLAARNVVVHAVALSDRAGQAVLRVPVVGGSRVDELGSLTASHDLAAETVEVAVAPLDALLGDAEAHFVKCDVEGHELAVLRGGSALLARSRPPVLVEIEERHNPGGIQRTFAHLAALGYTGWCVRPAGLTPLESFDLGRDQLAFLSGSFAAGELPPGYVNDFLFVPASSAASILALAASSE